MIIYLLGVSRARNDYSMLKVHVARLKPHAMMKESVLVHDDMSTEYK